MAPEQMDFLSKFINTHRVPEDALKYFHSIEWTHKYLSNPLYQPVPTFSRVLKSSGEDFFFSRTVNTPSTIPHLVTLQLKEFPPLKEFSKGQIQVKGSHGEVTQVPENPDIIVLLKLGELGLDGHPSVIHGGMSCAILDEMMGLCVMLRRQNVSGNRDSLFTANLNVTFRAPVPTPSEVFVRSWVAGVEGRKWFSRGQILDKDGRVLTEAEGLWVLVQGRREKL